MNKLILQLFSALLLPVLLALAGCAGSVRHGVTETGFYSTGMPRIEVEFDSALVLVDYGKLWAPVPSDDTMQSPTGSFAWSFHVAEEDGYVKGTAHVILSDLPGNGWSFEKETWGTSRHLLLSKSNGLGLFWTEHILYIPAEGDWFSALLHENGKEIPRVWIAKRWSATLVNDTTRFLVEYREPAPESLLQNLESGLTDKSILWMGAVKELEEFSRRAEASVHMDNRRRVASPLPTGHAPMRRPPFMPHMENLVGKSQSGWGGDNPWYD